MNLEARDDQGRTAMETALHQGNADLVTIFRMLQFDLEQQQQSHANNRLRHSSSSASNLGAGPPPPPTSSASSSSSSLGRFFRHYPHLHRQAKQFLQRYNNYGNNRTEDSATEEETAVVSDSQNEADPAVGSGEEQPQLTSSLSSAPKEPTLSKSRRKSLQQKIMRKRGGPNT